MKISKLYNCAESCLIGHKPVQAFGIILAFLIAFPIITNAQMGTFDNDIRISKLAILPFMDKVASGHGQASENEIRNQITQDGRFIIASDEELKKAYAKAELQMNNPVPKQKLVGLANAIPAHAIVLGNIMRFGDNLKLNIKIVLTTTNETVELANENINISNGIEPIRAELASSVTNAFDKLPYHGLVSSNVGGTIKIKHSKKAMLTVGDDYRIISVSAIKKHPILPRIKGFSVNEKAVIRVESDIDGIMTAKLLVSVDKSEIKKDDLVEFINPESQEYLAFKETERRQSQVAAPSAAAAPGAAIPAPVQAKLQEVAKEAEFDSWEDEFFDESMKNQKLEDDGFGKEAEDFGKEEEKFSDEFGDSNEEADGEVEIGDEGTDFMDEDIDKNKAPFSFGSSSDDKIFELGIKLYMGFSMGNYTLDTISSIDISPILSYNVYMFGWFFKYAGIDVDYLGGMMTQDVTLGDYGSVKGLPINMHRIQTHLKGRYIIPAGVWRPQIIAKVGYRNFRNIIDKIIDEDDQSLLYLATNTYHGPTVGAELVIPFYIPQVGLNGEFLYMPLTMHSEDPSGSTGTPFSASHYSFKGGLYWNAIAGLNFDFYFERHSFASTFEGAGMRFLTATDNASQSESYNSFMFGVGYTF
ncbi:MAG: hypothetical protein ABIA04_02780 [Pseudomonadota bacterium]